MLCLFHAPRKGMWVKMEGKQKCHLVIKDDCLNLACQCSNLYYEKGILNSVFALMNKGLEGDSYIRLKAGSFSAAVLPRHDMAQDLPSRGIDSYSLPSQILQPCGMHLCNSMLRDTLDWKETSNLISLPTPAKKYYHPQHRFLDRERSLPIYISAPQ